MLTFCEFAVPRNFPLEEFQRCTDIPSGRGTWVWVWGPCYVWTTRSFVRSPWWSIAACSSRSKRGKKRRENFWTMSIVGNWIDSCRWSPDRVDRRTWVRHRPFAASAVLYRPLDRRPWLFARARYSPRRIPLPADYSDCKRKRLALLSRWPNDSRIFRPGANPRKDLETKKNCFIFFVRKFRNISLIL